MTCIKSLHIRLEILDTWAKNGLKFRLCPDTHTMQFSAKPGVLEDWQYDHLKAMNQSFSEALRYQEGSCIACGMDAAKHPITTGRKQVFDPETGLAVVVPSQRLSKTFGYFEPVYEEAEVPEHLKAKMLPPLFCSGCWNNGAYERWAFGIKTGGASAKSTNGADTKADPFAGIDFDAQDSLFDGAAHGS